MTAPVAGAVRGRPSAARLAELSARAADHRDELLARQSEARALAAAIRVVARGVEAYALDHRGDMRQMQWSERLRGIAEQIERRWEAV